MKQPRSAVGIATSIFFIAMPVCAGLWFIGTGLLTHPLPWESVGWNTAPGTITGRTVTLRGRPTFGSDTSGRRSWFDADLAYQYEVDGKVYSGEDARFLLDERVRERVSRDEAEARAAERFPIGATATVHYDPNDPSRSTLQPGWSSAALPDFATGLSCFAVAGYVGWLMRKKPE